MAGKEAYEEQPEEETEQTREVRHNISTDEAFELAKDIYDIRSFIVYLYQNRATIARRLNVFGLICGIIFTMLYAAYNVWKIVSGELSLGLEIAVYVLLGVYVVLVVLLLCVSLVSRKATTKSIKKCNKSLKLFRFCIRIVSIAMAIVSIVISSLEAVNSADLAMQVVLVVVSIIIIVIQAVPILFGGIANLARWATAPAKGKARFSKVVLEWYQLVCSGGSEITSIKKISPKYVEDIGRCIDGYIIPKLGKKYITEIDAQMIYNTIDNCTEADRDIMEGVFKKVFSYAKECGYVATNITKDMGLEGSIDKSQKETQKKSGGRVTSWLGKKARSALDGFFSKDSDD